MKPAIQRQAARSRTHTIWIAGDLAQMRRIVQRYCDETGNCFAVTATDFIYTGGSESGGRVTRINYARFPASAKEIMRQTRDLAERLQTGLGQKSYSIETPSRTLYFSEPEK